MKIVVHGPRRHLPTSVAYRTDPLAAFSVEDEIPAAALLQFCAERLPVLRELQNQDLDAQEAAFTAKYRVQPPARAEATPRPPAAAEPLPQELRHRLRVAALRLQELTKEPVDVPTPPTVAEAERLANQLEYDIRGLEAKRTPAPDPDVGPRKPSIMQLKFIADLHVRARQKGVQFSEAYPATSAEADLRIKALKADLGMA